MSISIGGINLGEAVINLEYELNRTQQILEWVINNNQNLSAPSGAAMEKINNDAMARVIKKYPQAGIQKNKS